MIIKLNKQQKGKLLEYLYVISFCEETRDTGVHIWLCIGQRRPRGDGKKGIFISYLARGR